MRVLKSSQSAIFLTPISLNVWRQARVCIDLYGVLRVRFLPLFKLDNIKPTLPDKKAKRKEEADGGLFSKVLLKEKLKQSNGADLVIPLPTLVSMILTKKRGLDNLNVP